MSFLPRAFSYESMGTHWKITIWDAVDIALLRDIEQEVQSASAAFDRTYSRFIATSLVWELSRARGIVEVPGDLVDMLKLYKSLYDASGGACTPLVGFTLCDLGYDAEYSLVPKKTIRPVPRWEDAIAIVDDTHITLQASVLLDLGALGKGFFVDRIAEILDRYHLRHFLVDGSGDVYYRTPGETITVGLEHPGDTTKVIGTIAMGEGAMCSSAGNRRAWGSYHHTINPHTLLSPQEIIATWVLAKNAALADGLATCLSLVAPEQMSPVGPFEYCLLNHQYQVKRSEGFRAELF